MNISFDARIYFYSRLSKLSKSDFSKRSLNYKIPFFRNGTSGPKKAVSDLIIAIEKSKLSKTTFNFFNSDIHILNAGFHSIIWEKLKQIRLY